VNESEANKAVIGEWINHWSREVLTAIEPLVARLLEDQALVTIGSLGSDLRARVQKLGIQA